MRGFVFGQFSMVGFSIFLMSDVSDYSGMALGLGLAVLFIVLGIKESNDREEGVKK